MTSQSLFILHALSYAAGFWWVCYQKEIRFSTILISVLGGISLGIGALAGAKLVTHAPLLSQLPLLPFYSLIGAACFLWVQEREVLSQQPGRFDAYAVTLAFLYFVTPWKDNYVWLGYVGLIPAALVFLVCWRPQALSRSTRTKLMFWTLFASVAIGIQCLLVSPDSLVPPTSLKVGPEVLTAFAFKALQAAGLIALALNIFPFLGWLQGERQFVSDEESANEASPTKALMIYSLILGVPMLLNMKYAFVGYGALLDHSLAWGPVLAAAIAKQYCDSHSDSGFHDHAEINSLENQSTMDGEAS